MATKELRQPRVASYQYWDSPTGHNRLHRWSNGKWAIGCGPIEYISEDRAKELLAEWGLK